jgi:hypothetical protein
MIDVIIADETTPVKAFIKNSKPRKTKKELLLLLETG